MKLSIVIPAFNESRKIGYDIESAWLFLQKNGFSGEVIVADDGSTDQTSEAAIKAGRNNPPGVELKVIRHEHHRGKGYALRSGVKQTAGDYVMFADSGNCIPYNNALRGLELITSGQCDIAHGSRKITGTSIKKAQGLYRHTCSAFFHWFVLCVMRIPATLTDTQCGFKIYRGDIARRLFSECITDGFMFDIEMILRALKRGYKIKEFPIEWTCDPDSRLSPTRSVWCILKELIRIKAALRAEK